MENKTRFETEIEKLNKPGLLAMIHQRLVVAFCQGWEKGQENPYSDEAERLAYKFLEVGKLGEENNNGSD
jgi:hypothetical protein